MGGDIVGPRRNSPICAKKNRGERTTQRTRIRTGFPIGPGGRTNRPIKGSLGGAMVAEPALAES